MPRMTPNRRPRARDNEGFTLLELLVVMGLLAVLTGMAVGVLGRRDPHMIAASTIGGACRSAQITARSQGVPTEVWVRPGVDNQAALVQTLLLRPVAVFGFEPGQSSYDEALVPMIAALPDKGFGVEPEAAFALSGGMAVGASAVEDGLNVFAEGVPEDFGDRCIPRIFGRFCSVDI